MKKTKIIALLIAVPIMLIAAVAAYISWLFPLKKGTKSKIYVPLWGKILLCKFVESPVTYGVAVVSGTTVENYTEAYTIDNIWIPYAEGSGFRPGNVFDTKYEWLTDYYYDTKEVSYNLFLTEYRKYKDKIKNM